MSENPFRLFFGIDQTGAATKSGTCAKPLPCAVLFPVTSDSGKNWRLRLTTKDKRPLFLDGFNPQSFSTVLQQTAPTTELFSSATAIIVDCVFGLAHNAWPLGSRAGPSGLWNLFRQAATGDFESAGYGLLPAARFFNSIRARSDFKSDALQPLPVRRCETRSGANSVFRTRPYQRNIQCGTYRIWRDLGRAERPWASIWSFNKASGLSSRPWIFEGYPSLMWRQCFGFRVRQPNALAKRIREVSKKRILISKADEERICSSPDAADAAALAVGAWLFQEKGFFANESQHPRGPWLSREGWILGLDCNS